MASSDLILQTESFMIWFVCLAAVLAIVYLIGYLIFLFQKYVLAPNKALMGCLMSRFVREKDIRDIVRRGADPDYDNGLPLLAAVRGTRRKAAISGLIDCGADVNIVYPNGSGPLFHAVLAGNTAAVELLAASGANLGYKIKDGSNLLLCAVGAREYKTARLLIEKYGFDVNSKNNDGVTVLMAASEFCSWNFSFVKWLLKRPDINPDAVDSEGKTYKAYLRKNRWFRLGQKAGLLKFEN